MAFGGQPNLTRIYIGTLETVSVFSRSLNLNFPNGYSSGAAYLETPLPISLSDSYLKPTAITGFTALATGK